MTTKTTCDLCGETVEEGDFLSDLRFEEVEDICDPCEEKILVYVQTLKKENNNKK